MWVHKFLAQQEDSTVKTFRPLETLAELFNHTSFSTFSISGVIVPLFFLAFALSLPHLSCLSFVWVEVFVTVDEPVIFLSGLYFPASFHPPLFHPLGFVVSDLSESTDNCLYMFFYWPPYQYHHGNIFFWWHFHEGHICAFFAKQLNNEARSWTLPLQKKRTHM